MQGFNLPKADRNGFAEPYVMYWPRTNHVSRSLNPEWKDETIVVHADNPAIHTGALLHVIVVDYDAVGKDDFMCASSLSVSELIPGNHNGKKTLSIDRPLIREGQVAGRIVFNIDIEIQCSRRGSVAFLAPSRFFGSIMQDKNANALGDFQSEQTPPPPELQYHQTT
eukprot:scaffold3788_cov72-Cylindrotheca_fusiformis.AAC.1